MGILVIALSINPRPLSALELTLSGLIMGSRVDTAGDYPKSSCDNKEIILLYCELSRLMHDVGGQIAMY